MSDNDIRLGQFVTWRGMRALVVDRQYRADPRPHIQIQVAGGHRHWATPAELSPWNSERSTL